MKNKYHKLLVLLPLFQLLMANSPAPQLYDYEYKDYEISYVSEEQHYSYYFYHFYLHNTGQGYIDHIYFSNKETDRAFGAVLYGDDLGYPFYNALIQPGFDGEVVVSTQNKIPDSKQVNSEAYAFSTLAEEITFSETYEVKIQNTSNYDNRFYYEIKTSYSGEKDSEYYYGAAIEITYDGNPYCLESRSLDDLQFSTAEELDLTKLTVDRIVALKSTANRYYDYNLQNALTTLLIFLLVSGLILSFGIFAAIFFPAMARRKRRNRMKAAE